MAAVYCGIMCLSACDFAEVIEFAVEGVQFPPDVLFGLEISDLRQWQFERVKFEWIGLCNWRRSSFQCHAVEVVAVCPCSRGRCSDSG